MSPKSNIGRSPSTLKALVVDDSAYNRQTITSMLESLPDVEVVGRAMDGKEALKMAFDLEPDVITLDLEMPEMDGFSFLRLLMTKRPTPVLVVSGYANRENVFRALELGALDFVAKPTRDVSPDLKNIRLDLQQKIEVVRKLQVVRLRARAKSQTISGSVPQAIVERDVTQVLVEEPPQGKPPEHVVALVASTGGPPAVQQIVCALPAGLPAAIVIAQHMPARFTKAFAERLNRLAGMRVVEAQDGHRLCAGVVYIAPGSENLEVEMPERRDRPDALGILRVVPPGRTQTPVITPSGDHLFKSLGVAFGERLCGIILTGMGSDGTQGAVSAKHFGATIYAEDPRRAVMPGMPYSAVEAGTVDRVMPVEDVARAILEFCRYGV